LAGMRYKLGPAVLVCVVAGFFAYLLAAQQALAGDAAANQLNQSAFRAVIFYISLVIAVSSCISLAFVLLQKARKADRLRAARRHEGLIEQGFNPGDSSVIQVGGPRRAEFSALKTVNAETGKVTYDMHPVSHTSTEVGTFSYILMVFGIVALFPVYGLPAGIAVVTLAPLAARRFRPSLERTVGFKLIISAVIAAGLGALASLFSSMTSGLQPANVPADIPVYVPFALLGALVLSVVTHESAHGLVAYWCGDPTAKNAGRLTLNPVKHFDLFGSFILPALLFVITNFNIALGYAKPVPINMSSFGRQRRDRIFTATSGATANFMLAAGSLTLLVVIVFIVSIAWPGAEVSGFSEFLQGPVLKNVPAPYMWAGLVQLLKSFFVVNIVLGVLNMVPVPPLDGSFVLETLLPRNLRFYFRLMRVFGFAVIAAVLALLMVTGVFGYLMDLIMGISTVIRFVTHLN